MVLVISLRDWTSSLWLPFSQLISRLRGKEVHLVKQNGEVFFDFKGEKVLRVYTGLVHTLGRSGGLFEKAISLLGNSDFTNML